MKKSNEIYSEAFDKAFGAVLKELAAYNCNNLGDLMLFSEYMLDRTCYVDDDGRILSQRKFYNSVNELPEECKKDYDYYMKVHKQLLLLSNPFVKVSFERNDFK